MNEVMNVAVTSAVNSQDFLNAVINPERIKAGLKPLDNRKLNLIIEDELLDELPVRKIIPHPYNPNQQSATYDLNRDQMLLVGMRQSKVVRKAVLQYVRKLEDKVTQQQALLIQQQQSTIEQLDKQVRASVVLTDTSAVYKMGQVAEHVGVSTTKLNKVLRKLGILKPSMPKRGAVPNEAFITEGAFQRVIGAWGAEYFVTGKGLLWIMSKSEEWGLTR